MVQPPRGFGENPVAIYHDPDLPPPPPLPGRLPLAATRRRSARDAVVHLGKHGNLEWLPGKTLGMSAACGADAALGDLPLIYPFLVNDPGEGTQAKRRAHATLVDHLIPPMARAETYGDIARLEQLLDEHANIAALDPAKLPAIRQQIWTLMRAAKMDHDLGLDERPDDDAFDDMLLHVDGWLCEIKDVQIRDGLHILGAGADRRGPSSTWCWPSCGPASCAAASTTRARACAQALGLRRGRHRRPRRGRRPPRPRARALRRRRCRQAGWDADAVASTRLDRRPPTSRAMLRFAATEVVPRLAGTDRRDRPASCTRSTAASSPAGPSGSPLRGLVNVLPTGRNFYSVDPKAVPSRLAWETGAAMADSLLARYRDDHGELAAVGRAVGVGHRRRCAPRATTSPRCSRCSACGRSGTRRRAGSPASSRSPLAELGRPRIDVTVRISGFFRDAFPHVVDDARRRGAAGRRASTSPPSDNYVRAHAQADLAEHGDRAPRHHTDLRLQAGHLRRRAAAADRQPQLARRRRPRRGLRGLGRLRLRPRPGRRAAPPTT